ncbi:hypothetical protein EV426DRAFT_621629, partial [Tirmania nivea]
LSIYYIVIPYDYFLIMLIPVMDTCYLYKDFCIISFTYLVFIITTLCYFLLLEVSAYIYQLS